MELSAILWCVYNSYSIDGPPPLPNDGRVISNFICQALLQRPLTIYGNGNQTRSFCYLEDLVECLITLMNSTFSGPINIGSDEEISINQLGYLINKTEDAIILVTDLFLNLM